MYASRIHNIQFILAMDLKCTFEGCGRLFTQRNNLTRHIKIHTQEKKYRCSKCPKLFQQKTNALRHEKTCNYSAAKPSGSGIQRTKTISSSPHHFKIMTTQTAFSRASVTWKLKYKDNDAEDTHNLLDMSTAAMEGHIRRYQQKRQALKFNMVLRVMFEQATDPSIVTNPAVPLLTEQFEVYEDTDVDELLNLCSLQLQNRIESYEGTGSGWILSHLVDLDTTVWQLDPLRASTYHPLPAWVQNTKSVRNVKNRDNMCFKWSVLAALYTPDDRNSVRVLSYQRILEDPTTVNVPDFSMLTYPVTLKNINKFETRNNISVNVYSIEEKKNKDDASQDAFNHRVAAIPPEEDDDSEELLPSECDLDTPGQKRHRTQSDSEEEPRRKHCVTEEDDEFDDVDFDDDVVEEEESEETTRGVVYPIRVTKHEMLRHINLLLTEQDGIRHYSAITNFSGLLNSQYNKHSHRLFYCYSCLHGFKAKKGEKTREDCHLLKEHVKYCKTQTPQHVTYPTKGKDDILQFTNIRKQLEAPFVVYADFECCLKEISDKDVKTGLFPATNPPLVLSEKGRKEWEKKEKEYGKEFKYQAHEAASYWYKIVSIDPNFDIPEREIYIGEDAAEHMLDDLKKDAKQIFNNYIKTPKKMNLSSDEQQQFNDAIKCHICNEKFTNTKDGKKVRDHCHILGHFRGAAHNKCNLNYKIDPKTWKLPIFFHNLRGYDGHLIIKAAKKEHGRIRVIPNNLEKFMAFSIGRMQFLDSFQFTMKSLDNLVSTLDDADFKYTRKMFNTDVKFHLMRKKGVFPYDFFNHISKLTSLEEIEFPAQDVFFNKLNNQECSMDDYLHGKLVWDTFCCKTFKAYHDLYLRSDVLLLADFFEKFRKMCMDSYGLDAAHYYTAPGMAWDAALKLTKVKLELFKDEDMYMFIERSIRGGISQISKRYAKANNPRCRDYDPLKPITHLIYLDANNLYGWAMSQSLPTHGFRWLCPEEIRNLDINTLRDDSVEGYIFEVDLQYPQKLHDRHNSYPLAPERLTIDESMLSPLQKNFPKQKLKSTTKLAPNLRNKHDYVTHYRNLKFYLKQGMVITRIHRVLAFKQSTWLKRYIDFNTQCRSLATSDFAKDFFKLMNNSVFGKTQENLRNRVNVEVITEENVALKRVCKPSFKRSQRVREDLVIMQTAIATLKLDKPLYVGFTVLDLSKLLMYQFHYEQMLPRYTNIQLCFTDTDSLLYEIETLDVYADMLQTKEVYDFSEYPFKHPNYDPTNKKVIGKFKDELHSRPLEEFIGVAPKCYSLLFHGEVKKNVIVHTSISEKQTAKGTKTEVKKRFLRHTHYKESLTNLSTIRVKQNVIRSKAQMIGTYHQTKISLTAFDTKRYILENNIDTLAHGHYKTYDVENEQAMINIDWDEAIDANNDVDMDIEHI